MLSVMRVAGALAVGEIHIDFKTETQFFIGWFRPHRFVFLSLGMECQRVFGACILCNSYPPAVYDFGRTLIVF